MAEPRLVCTVEREGWLMWHVTLYERRGPDGFFANDAYCKSWDVIGQRWARSKARRATSASAAERRRRRAAQSFSVGESGAR